jgi:hypothetical protein
MQINKNKLKLMIYYKSKYNKIKKLQNINKIYKNKNKNFNNSKYKIYITMFSILKNWKIKIMLHLDY